MTIVLDLAYQTATKSDKEFSSGKVARNERERSSNGLPTKESSPNHVRPPRPLRVRPEKVVLVKRRQSSRKKFASTATRPASEIETWDPAGARAYSLHDKRGEC